LFIIVEALIKESGNIAMRAVWFIDILAVTRAVEIDRKAQL
jgi:hypothetical protein